MMFWFNKWYSKQRTDYNIVVRLIIILGSRLPDSHSPSSALAHSRFSTHTLRLLTKLIPHGLASLCLFIAPPRMCSAKARSQGHVDLFYETIHLKDRRHIEPSRLSRHCLWFDRYLRPFVHDTTYIYIYELPPTHKLSTTPSNTKINNYRLIAFFPFKRRQAFTFWQCNSIYLLRYFVVPLYRSRAVCRATESRYSEAILPPLLNYIPLGIVWSSCDSGIIEELVYFRNEVLCLASRC